jgi:hypothetical protein
VAKQKETDVDKWARLKKLRLEKTKSSASEKQDARFDREDVHAKKEIVRVRKQRKDLATLEFLHSEICERTHPLIGHSAWGNIVIRLGFKSESTEDLSRCANCHSDIPPGEASWVMNKRIRQNTGKRSKQKFRVHYCQKCGLPLLLPEPGTPKQKKSNPSNAGASGPRKSARPFSGPRGNRE